VTDEETKTLENANILVKARTEQLREALKENERLRQALKEKSSS
jgi:hypothetical protein